MRKLFGVVVVVLAAATPQVVTAVAPSLTIKATPTTVVYGGAATLSGVLSTGKSGQTVTVEQQECGKSSFTKIATSTTTSGGGWSFAAHPVVNTVYQARYKAAVSPAVPVGVKPVLKLKKVATAKFKVTLTAGLSFAGKYVLFQRNSSGRWVTVTKITLKTAQASGPAPTTVSSATQKVRVKTGLKVRVALPKTQAGCYLPTASPSIRS